RAVAGVFDDVELLDVLTDAVFVDLEVVGGEAGHERAVAAAHDDVDLDERGGRAEGGGLVLRGGGEDACPYAGAGGERGSASEGGGEGQQQNARDVTHRDLGDGHACVRVLVMCSRRRGSKGLI